MDGHVRTLRSRRLLTAGGMLLCALLLPPRAGLAQESADGEAPGLFDRAGLSGSIRAAYWSSTRQLDSEDHFGAGTLWVKSTRRVSSQLSFFIEGWTTLRSSTTGADAAGELREAFIDLRFERLDVRAGRQIIAWGRADGINPTDNLTGRDLTLLASDEDDQRLGTTAVRASYYLGGVSVTAVWLPGLRVHRFPLPESAAITFVSERDEWPGDQWALRIERTGGAVDWSLSYFDGRDLTPDLRPSPAMETFDGEFVEADLPASASLRRGSPEPDGQRPQVSPRTAITLSHHRLHVFGADMAVNLGRIALRAEGAYIDTSDPGGRDPFTKNPFVLVVVGGDRTFGEYLNANVQYIHRLVRGVRTPQPSLSAQEARFAELQSVLNNQTRRTQHGASLRVSNKWRRETLEAECAVVGYFGPDGLALRPKVSYAVTDRWKALVGADVYRGDSSSVFGLLRPNSTVYLEARWSF